MPARSSRFVVHRGWGYHAVVYGLIVLLVCTGRMAGQNLDSPKSTIGLCALILVTGLPHGSLDIELLVRQAHRDARVTVGLIALYVAIATATLALWEVSPVAGLIAFLLISIVHFADDWGGGADGFFAGGTALALLSASSLLYRAEISHLFVELTNDAAARYVADLMTLVAPVATGIAFAAMIVDWTSQRFDMFVARSATMLAMLVLPPLVGFALYFCLFHSPRNLAQGLAACRGNVLKLIGFTVVPVTLAAFGIAALVFILSPRASLSAAAVPTAFMTLSLLTVPHMLVPLLCARWQDR